MGLGVLVVPFGVGGGGKGGQEPPPPRTPPPPFSPGLPPPVSPPPPPQLWRLKKQFWCLLGCSASEGPQRAGAFAVTFRVLSRKNMTGDDVLV